MATSSTCSAPRSSLAPWLRLLGAVALATLPACSFGEVDGNGDRVDELREAATFSKVKSDAELDEQVVQGEEPTIVVSIDQNLQGLVETRVVDDVLLITTRDRIGRVVPGPHLLLVVPQLQAAKVAGSGSFVVVLDQPELPFDLILSGSGVMSFQGSAPAIGAYLSGSGDIRLAGETSDIDIELSGSGSVRGKNLLAESGSIELSGSGDVSATVESSVAVSLSGSGQIDLYGDPSIDHYSHEGSGDIVEH